MKDKKPLLLLGALLLLPFLTKAKAAPGNNLPPTSGAGNGYTPTQGSEGSLNESYLGITPTANNRGIRNNNPGNIKFSSSNAWQGKIAMTQNTDAIDPSDGQPTFEQFSSYPYGVRAIIYLIKNSYIPNGFNTLAKIIQRYANTTGNYLIYVSQKTGKAPTEPISATDETTIKKLVQAIGRFENGQTATGTPEAITDLQYQTARNIL